MHYFSLEVEALLKNCLKFFKPSQISERFLPGWQQKPHNRILSCPLEIQGLLLQSWDRCGWPSRAKQFKKLAHEDRPRSLGCQSCYVGFFHFENNYARRTMVFFCMISGTRHNRLACPTIYISWHEVVAWTCHSVLSDLGIGLSWKSR